MQKAQVGWVEWQSILRVWCDSRIPTSWKGERSESVVYHIIVIVVLENTDTLGYGKGTMRIHLAMEAQVLKFLMWVKLQN